MKHYIHFTHMIVDERLAREKKKSKHSEEHGKRKQWFKGSVLYIGYETNVSKKCFKITK